MAHPTQPQYMHLKQLCKIRLLPLVREASPPLFSWYHQEPFGSLMHRYLTLTPLNDVSVLTLVTHDAVPVKFRLLGHGEKALLPVDQRNVERLVYMWLSTHDRQWPPRAS